MAYTEIKERNEKKYFYRVVSMREGKKVSKKRKYLGVNLLAKDLSAMEKKADKEFNINIKKNPIEKIKSKIIKILRKNKVMKAGIFGSYARGDQKENSDIDILVEINDKNMSLLDFIELKLRLENILGKKIDLVEYKAIKPLIRERILNEEIKIL